MSPSLIVHVGAGVLGILSGTAALSARKGMPRHRAFGKTFVLSMLTTGVMGAFLALYLPQTGFLPRRASVAVALLTCYLVATAWTAVRNQEGRVGRSDMLAFVLVLGVAAALFTWGLQAANSPTGRLEGYPPAPYFVFASFATLAAALDVRMFLRGGISGVARIARHLWRMCFALFFATAFLFLGQQKVMPEAWRGAPVFVALAVAPFVIMLFWLARVRLSRTNPITALAAPKRHPSG